jgi:hypothetical protein
MRKSVTFLIALFSVAFMQAQQGAVASGGFATGAGGSFSYSVGQVFYTTNTEATGSVSQGMQQAFEIISLSNQSPTKSDIVVNVFPNPTSDQIILSLSNMDRASFSYMLFDLNGKAISNAVLLNSSTPVAMQSLSKGIYILKVNQNNSEFKTFKIIKN